MKIFNFIGSSVFQITSFIFVVSYLLGVLNIHFSDRNDYCEMTYMFEYPQFVRVAVPENDLYPQYALYAYSEGRFTEKSRKMWFDGVPVLFLPGNSGSHMQARSLASVALRKALADDVFNFHFDYFTISFNEELSGLYGGVLSRQTKFASACIARILRLYKNNKYIKNAPTSVILIGHSMGGVVAKRLLIYPRTFNTTSIAITLAAPVEAPAVNFDLNMNAYYATIHMQWDKLIASNRTKKKMLLSFGSGPRDKLMPSSLTCSKHSFINALTTAIPGVWVSPDHVGIVWCKQFVMVINKYLFDIIDPNTQQISDDYNLLASKARQYFQANRSMTLSPNKIRPNVTMLVDAFWYEDNRRIFQVSRPEINKTTYLMIRLVNFPQNRFAAVETVNVSDKDWVFGCNAKFSHNNYRYCQEATSLTELSRWTAAAVDFGKRKLATINLHSIKELQPDWTHVVVKVSPSRKPVTLNVDINDYASRQITTTLPITFSPKIIKQETEPNSLYYELLFPNFNVVYQAYYLYVEPTASCKASQYHVSAEMHIPWAENHEYYHYFTHISRSPMKLRLPKSNPNITDTSEHVKITLLLDPQCTFTISISSAWYQRLAQMARNYTPVLMPYVAVIVLLAARNSIIEFNEHGIYPSIHQSLMSNRVKPYYVVACARMGFTALTSVQYLSYIFEDASWKNYELQYFARSLLVFPAYMAALGAVHIATAALLIVMLGSSQIAHRMLFRIMWRGGVNLAERVASGLQKLPLVASIAILTGVPMSCGAASLAAGAAFNAFMLSKMYEEYLEDYVYKLMAKVAARMCRLFSRKTEKLESETRLVPLRNENETTSEMAAIEDKENDNNEGVTEIDNQQNEPNTVKAESAQNTSEENNVNERETQECESDRIITEDAIDDMNNINFHMMMFCLWLCVTLVNVPALLTWARNFKYSMALVPDASFIPGLFMAASSMCLWQLNGPRKRLKHYEDVANTIFVTAIFVIVIGIFSLSIVSYSLSSIYLLITLQQVLDSDLTSYSEVDDTDNNDETRNKESNEENKSEASDPKKSEDKPNGSGDSQETGNTQETSDTQGTGDTQETGDTQKTSKPTTSEGKQDISGSSEDCACNENRIYTMFKNLRDKFSFSEE